MSVLQKLLGQQRLLEAGEQVAVLGGVSQSICCLLVDLREALLPQLHHPAGGEADAAQHRGIMSTRDLSQSDDATTHFKRNMA